MTVQNYIPNGYQKVPGAFAWDEGLKKIETFMEDNSVRWVHNAFNPAISTESLIWHDDGTIEITSFLGQFPTYTLSTLPVAGHRGRMANVTDGNPPGLYFDDGVAWVPLFTNAVLPTYTVATLPVGGPTGRLARVTDGIRGVWISTAAGWRSLTGYAYIGDFTSIADAISSLGVTPATLVVDSNLAVTANRTFPATLAVRVVGAGGFMISDTKTLTFNGPLYAARQKIFFLTGSGNAFLPAASEVYPEWWGTGTADDTSAFTAMVAALPATATHKGGKISLNAGTYLVKNWLPNLSGLIVEGAGSGYPTVSGSTILRPPNGVGAGDYVIGIPFTGIYNVTLKNFYVVSTAPNGSDNAGRGIVFNGTRTRLENVTVVGGTVWAIDNDEPGGGPSDSMDAAGIFNCAVYSAGIHITSANLTVADSYFLGNGATTAITIDGTNGNFTANNISIMRNKIENYVTPLISVGTFASSIHITGNHLAPSGGAASIITFGTANANSIASGTIRDNTIQGASTEVRAITFPTYPGYTAEMEVSNNRISGTYSGGTGAAILLTGYMSTNIYISDYRGIEYNGYMGSEFRARTTSIDAAAEMLGQFSFKGIALTTTDATPTVIFAPVAMTANTITTLRAYVTGKRPDGAEATGGFLYERQAAFDRSAGGTSAQVASTIAVVTIEKDVAANCDIVLSTNTPTVQVTGVAARTFSWVADVEWTRR